MTRETDPHPAACIRPRGHAGLRMSVALLAMMFVAASSPGTAAADPLAAPMATVVSCTPGDMNCVIETGILGTPGDDAISVTAPLLTEAIAGPAASDNVQAMATGVHGAGGQDNVHVSAPVTTNAGASLDDQGFFGSGGSTAVSRGIVGGSGQDTIVNLSGIASTSQGDTNVNQVFLPEMSWFATGVPVYSVSEASGIDAGGGLDNVANRGSILATALDNTRAAKERFELLALPVTLGLWDATTGATATATGISGGPYGAGGGARSLANFDNVTATAEANASLWDWKLEVVGGSRLDGSTNAFATAIGLDGGERPSVLSNAGRLDVDAVSDALLASIEVKWKGLGIKGIFSTFTDTGSFVTLGKSEAAGLRGGEGDDRISNEAGAGLFDVSSKATAHSTTVVVALGLMPPSGSTPPAAPAAGAAALARPLGDPPGQIGGEAQEAQLDTGTLARSVASGISAGGGADFVSNGSFLRSKAESFAGSVTVDVDISFSPNPGGLNWLPLPSMATSKSKTEADAFAMGIDAGTGDDNVVSTARIEATSWAEADSTSVGVVFKGQPNGLGAALNMSDATTVAVAGATGIAGGAGADTIGNMSEIASTATAKSDSIAVKLNAAGQTGAAFVGGLVVSKADTSARSSTAGIDGGSGAGTGAPDVITTLLPSGRYAVDSLADSDAYSLGVSVEFAGAVGASGAGLVLAGTYSQAKTTADAYGYGILSGDGGSRVENGGDLRANGTADATSTRVDVKLSGVTQGVVLGATVSDTSTETHAEGAGIAGGAGADVIENRSSVEALSTATSTTTGIGVDVTGTVTGLAADVVLSKSTTDSTAASRGISGGAGNDNIVNAGTIHASATSTDTVTEVGVSLQGALEGLTVGVMLSKSGITSTADSWGIEAGEGDDRVENRNSVLAEASASGKLRSWRFDVGVSKIMALEVAVADAKNQADATAVGIAGGAGNDVIANDNQVTANAKATPSTLSVGVAVAGAPLSVAGNIAWAETIGNATAFGLDGGSGNDRIENRGVIAGLADAQTTTDAVSADVGLLGVSYVQAAATPTARFVGIGGGAGADNVINGGTIGFEARSNAGSLAVAGALGLFGYVQGDVSSTAKSYATGIDGDLSRDDPSGAGAGNDNVVNLGTIAPLATATANGRSISGQLFGISNSTGTTTAEATAAGIAGGAGADALRNEGVIDARSTSTGTGWAISGSLLGWNLTDLGTTANAWATGLSGGAGDDAIVNIGTDNALAQATASGNAISGTVAGITSGGSATHANATAAGIDGGDGRDVIWNGGVLKSVANATANGMNVSAAILGWDIVDPVLGGKATALGIDGGAGDDVIVNAALEGHDDHLVEISARAHASTDGLDIAANVAGFADVGRNPDEGGLFAYATGIAGGKGADAIWNEGTISATATGDAKQAALSVAGIGYAKSATAAGSSVYSIGIDAGDGNDNVVNLGSIVAGGLPAGRTALATVGVRDNGKLDVSEAGTGIGYAYADSALGAYASAAGIVGGAGNDILENHGSIQAGFLDNAAGAGTKTAMAKISAKNYAIALLGKADVSSIVGATAESVGIDGGEGADVVANGATGTVTVRASADTYSKDTSGSGAFASKDSTVSTAARADGLRGGAGDDVLVNDAAGSNAGSIVVEAKSVVEGDGGAGSLLFADASVITKSTATAVGIRGDVDPATAGAAAPAAGNDNVINRGSVRATATAESWARPDAWAAFGHVSATGQAKSYATAAAVDAGGGSNFVWNAGALRAEATAGMRLSASIDTDFSSTEANLHAIGSAQAYGIAAGDGGNRVVQTSAGAIEAVALIRTGDAAGNNADGYADEEALVTGGSWNAGAEAIGTPISALASGISLGSGADNVAVAGTVSAAATVSATLTARSNSNPWAASGKAVISGQAVAAGIDAGAGTNDVRNDGQIVAAANGYANPIARSYSLLSTASSYATATVKAEATGILGDGRLLNASTGTVNVTARANSYADAYTNTESTNANAVLTATATGMGTKGETAGVQSIRNDGTLSVGAYGGEDAGGAALAPGYTDSDLHVRANTANTTTSITLDAAGIRARAGQNDIVNAGHIEVVGHARNHVWAVADNYWETATGNANPTVGSVAQGIVTAGGINRISNYGWIGVRSTAADVWGRGDTWSMHDDCYSTATVRGAAAALGMSLQEAGTYSVLNRGVISAVADADARAEAWADTHWWNDEYETASATAGAAAMGIIASISGGSSDVRNEGTLSVRATASASAATYGGIGSRPASAGAFAYGIQTGGGADTIRNTGTIDVLSAGPAGSTVATGIRSGAGNDLIVNEGLILGGTFTNPSVLRTLVSAGKAGDPAAAGFTAGIGIDAGDGDDWVTLSGTSRVVGSVLLGAGNDTLELSGTPTVTGAIDGGGGTNTLRLSDAGFFAAEPTSIQRVVKDGPGTFTMSGLAARRTYTMLGGTLEVGSLGSMDNTSVFEALVKPDGTHGVLRAGNNVVLDGGLTVLRSGGVYRSSRSVILEARTLSGSFDTVALPASSTLLRFAYARVDNQAVVTVEADPFVKVARNGAEAAVAGHLDAIAPTVSGDLAARLSAMQMLAASDFAGAFSSLSPETFNAGTRSVLTLGAAGLRNLQARMENLRLSIPSDTSFAARLGGLRLASAAPVPGTGIVPVRDARRPYDVWLSGYSQTGDQDADSGFTGFSFQTWASALGVDVAVGEQLRVGTGVEWANADVDLDAGRGNTSVGSTSWLLYGTWAGRRAYFEGAFSLGRDAFTNRRLVTGGAVDFFAGSEHDGHALSALAGGGYRVPVAGWTVVPRADLLYVRLKEDGFRESGADNSVLIVAERTTESLVSDLGVRVSRSFRLPTGSLVPEIGLGWGHDFDIGDRQIVAAFAGAPGVPFALETPVPARNWASGEAGVAFASDAGLAAALKYLGEFRSGSGIHTVLGELRVSF